METPEWFSVVALICEVKKRPATRSKRCGPKSLINCSVGKTGLNQRPLSAKVQPRTDQQQKRHNDQAPFRRCRYATSAAVMLTHVIDTSIDRAIQRVGTLTVLATATLNRAVAARIRGQVADIGRALIAVVAIAVTRTATQDRIKQASVRRKIADVRRALHTVVAIIITRTTSCYRST
jgi:hypothetical protein